MAYEVVRLGHEALRERAQEVDPKVINTKPFQKLLDDLITTMRNYDGVGIAAPQIGLSQRIFCVECRKNRRYPGMPTIPVYVVINPKLRITDKRKTGLYEGCLSIPELHGYVERARGVRVTGLDRFGKPLEVKASGFHARILQHEMDHLNEKLYIDRVKNTRTLSYVEHF